MEPRKHPRYTTKLPVLFSGDQTQGQGTVFNISVGGCAVQSKAAVARGAYLKLDMEVPGVDSPIVVELAPVRWTSNGNFGMEFIRMDEESQTHLRRYVSTLNA